MIRQATIDNMPITPGLIEYNSDMREDIESVINDFCKELEVDEVSVFANIDRGFTNITLSMDGGLIYGLIGWIKNNDKAFGEIFYVVPHKRNTRLAYKLLKHAEKLASFHGCKSAVSVVKEQRFNLYKNRGYSNTHYVMEKDIERV